MRMQLFLAFKLVLFVAHATDTGFDNNRSNLCQFTQLIPVRVKVENAANEGIMENGAVVLRVIWTLSGGPYV